MLQLNYIREEKEKAIQKLAKRGFDATNILVVITSCKVQAELDSMQSNQIAKEIGMLFKNELEKANAKAQTATLKEKSKSYKNSNQKSIKIYRIYWCKFQTFHMI